MKNLIIFLIIVVFTACSQQDPETARKEAKKNYELGNLEYKNGNYKAAIRQYDKAIDLDDEMFSAYLKRGDSKRKLRDSKGAIKDYERVVELNPINSRAWYHMGTLKYNMGDKREGCEDISRARQLCYMPAEKFYKEFCK